MPLCWASYTSRTLNRSQNVLEEAMLLQIKAALPPEVHVVILADRGFDRAELVRCCQRLRLGYLIRITDDVIVKTDRWRGNLQHFPIRRGDCRVWGDVEYRQDAVVRTNLIVRWKKGLPRKKDQPWYLVTSLPAKGRQAAKKLSDVYALRFDIEELFRDTKNEHLGWSLGKTRADRLDRLILIAALAYVLLVALGLWCREHRPARLWATNQRRNELSAFAIGRVMWDRECRSIQPLIRLLMSSLATAEGKWG